MKRKLIVTKDGSHTFFVPELNEHYHSTFGAIQESKHVFIKSGLTIVNNNPLSILEIGFGTGLNAFLTYLVSLEENRTINYQSLELFPLDTEETKQLNYSSILSNQEVFEKIHSCKWETPIHINNFFTLKKINADIKTFKFKEKYDLIYFDAFAPEIQPELWEEKIFKKIFDAMNSKGILVTYCAKGIVGRRLKATGFHIERLAGPPGKREMIRALKLM